MIVGYDVSDDNGDDDDDDGVNCRLRDENFLLIGTLICSSVD